MVVTPFALLILLLGTYGLFRGTPLTMFSLLLVATLFGGSAAFILAAAGGSSIPPAQFMLGFLALRLLLPGAGQMESLKRAVFENRYLLGFVTWGVISAFTLPVIFERKMEVTPLKPIVSGDMFAVLPLHMTPQNFTTAFYMCGTLIAGIAATASMQRPGAAQRLVKVGSGIAVAHALLGIASVVLRGTAFDRVLALFRNGNYAQLSQSFDGLVRMSGIWPEPAGFANYGAVWFILMAELWFRDVMPRRTGLAALILLLALCASTSSTAYVSLGTYGLFVLARFLLGPMALPVRKWLLLIMVGVLAITLVLAAFAIVPSLAGKLQHVLELMTIQKSQSTSGVQRAFWAKQGLEAFMDSFGLGIGAGSFRSSSLITAILGSTGIIGTLTFLAHLLRSAQPFRAEFLLLRSSNPQRAVGVAASTTCLFMLAPAMVAAPSPDPGIMWAVICGIALALRPIAVRHPAYARPRGWAAA